MVVHEQYGQLVYKSKAWQELRRNLIIQRGARCQECGKDFSFDTSQLIGHHIIELTADNYQDANIAYNPDNIKLVCINCHNKEHARFEYRGHKVVIVYGCPRSGKTTLVKQMLKRGDLIVDVDELYKAVSGLSMYNKPNNLLKNVLGLRDSLIDQIRLRVGYWNTAYIIGGYPNKLEREQLAHRLNAELLYVDCTKELCLARCEQLGAYCKKWQGFVNSWWENYQE